MSSKCSFIVLCAFATCFVLYPFTQRILWIGKFDLTIHIQGQGGRPIKSVIFDDVRRETGRDRIEDYEWHPERKAFDIDGSVVLIHVTCTGRDDGWGRRLSYSELDRILLQVEFEDGTIVRKIVDIPSGQGPREMTVDIP